MASSESTALAFALIATVAGIATWFVVVFRQLAAKRNIYVQIIESFGSLATVAAEANAAMVALGRQMRESVAQMEATLSPKQREIYNELRGIGVYPLDAMNEACARWPE